MNSIRAIEREDFPELLKEADGLPDRLRIKGEFPKERLVYLTIVGSRRYSQYGKEAAQALIEGLRGLPIAIVSGLAFGIDAIAHKAALDAGLKTIAVPGSGLSDEALYPRSHLPLAQEILESGGALISPFEDDERAAPWTFPMRNRIMAGLSHAVLVIEAQIRSGTLITSKHATEFNRNVFAVPGSIFSSQSAGPHMLIRLGATPITCADDLRDALGFPPGVPKPNKDRSDLSPDELAIVEALESPLSREALLDATGLEASKANSLISLLEIKGVIEERLGELSLV